MLTLDASRPGSFCWLDLAANDVASARQFYAATFGWTFVEQHANGGRFMRCQADGRDVGSLYQLTAAQLEHGVPSHWTPYIRVERVDAVARHVVTAGGRLLVGPFDVERVARIALIEDAVGALVGLWQPLDSGAPGPDGVR